MTDSPNSTVVSEASDAELLALFERWRSSHCVYLEAAKAKDIADQLFTTQPEDAKVKKAIGLLGDVLDDLNKKLFDAIEDMAVTQAHSVMGIALKGFAAWQMNGGGAPTNQVEELALAATHDALRLADLDIEHLKETLTDA